MSRLALPSAVQRTPGAIETILHAPWADLVKRTPIPAAAAELLAGAPGHRSQVRREHFWARLTDAASLLSRPTHAGVVAAALHTCTGRGHPPVVLRTTETRRMVAPARAAPGWEAAQAGTPPTFTQLNPGSAGQQSGRENAVTGFAIPPGASDRGVSACAIWDPIESRCGWIRASRTSSERPTRLTRHTQRSKPTRTSDFLVF